MRRSAALCAAVFFFSSSIAASARAQGNPRAESLFQEARTLVEQGHYAEACPKLAESQRLEPAVGTQFNLADCYEHVGRTASAHALFLEVAAIAHAAGKFEREKSARERAQALEPTLARVRVVVAADAPGLEVHIDEAAIERAKWSTAFPVDPGAHRITASAPGRRPFAGSFEATPSSAVDTAVPALEELEPRAPAVAPVVIAPERPRGPSPVTYVAGGVAIAALATGAVAGILSLARRSDAQEQCPQEIYAFRCPTESGADAWNGATSAGDVATVGFVVAGVALAATAVLWITTHRTPRARTAASSYLLGGSFR